MAITDQSTLDAALAEHSLVGLWNVGRGTIPHEPSPQATAQHWNWSDLERLLLDAGRVIPAAGPGSTRAVPVRAVCLRNDALSHLATTDTLCACVQHIAPGEAPPPHRHTYQAIRFVLAGHGAQTSVDGDIIAMEPGDLIVTPGWSWHGHRNDSDEPAIWLDGVDLPLVLSLGVNFSEPAGDRDLPTRLTSEPMPAGLRALTWNATGDRSSPLCRYAWASTERALEQLAERESVARVEFVNPKDGAPVATTFACEMIRLAPGVATPMWRETSSSIVQVFRGRGHATINGQSYEWNPVTCSRSRIGPITNSALPPIQTSRRTYS